MNLTGTERTTDRLQFSIKLRNWHISIEMPFFCACVCVIILTWFFFFELYVLFAGLNWWKRSKFVFVKHTLNGLIFVQIQVDICLFTMIRSNVNISDNLTRGGHRLRFDSLQSTKLAQSFYAMCKSHLQHGCFLSHRICFVDVYISSGIFLTHTVKICLCFLAAKHGKADGSLHVTLRLWLLFAQ